MRAPRIKRPVREPASGRTRRKKMNDWFKARNIWGAAILTLSDAEAGRLAKAIWGYTMSGEEQNLSGAEKGLFAMIQMQLDQDAQRDADISEKLNGLRKKNKLDIPAFLRK